MSIEVRNVTRRFGAFAAVDQVDLRVDSGELVALLGPSGSGKTTLLRIIAGLEPTDSGSIHFDGADATDESVRERRVGFVFQHYALFRHLTVFENIAFGLRVRPRRDRPSEKDIRASVQRLLTLVQLDSLAQRYPSQLSGGQRQRVALARALAVEPRVLLLDEPFGALDAKVRKELRRWLRRLHDELHVTSLFVTHDQDEALELADRVVIMNHGKIEQVGSPDEVYANPASPFVLDFLGDVNVWHYQIQDGRVVVGGVTGRRAGRSGAGAGERQALRAPARRRDRAGVERHARLPGDDRPRPPGRTDRPRRAEDGVGRRRARRSVAGRLRSPAPHGRRRGRARGDRPRRLRGVGRRRRARWRDRRGLTAASLTDRAARQRR